MQCFKKINQKWLHVFHHLKYWYFFQVTSVPFFKILRPENWHNTCLYNSYYKFYVVSSGTVVQAQQCKEKEKGKSGVKDTYDSTA